MYVAHPLVGQIGYRLVLKAGECGAVRVDDGGQVGVGSEAIDLGEEVPDGQAFKFRRPPSLSCTPKACGSDGDDLVLVIFMLLEGQVCQSDVAGVQDGLYLLRGVVGCQ